MELRQLKYFVAAAKSLNFSTAAKSLNITQSTLSQQIKQLENELGDDLFYRTSHEVTLTESGSALLPYAIKTVSDADNCRQRVDDISIAQGHVVSHHDVINQMNDFIKAHS